MPSRIRLSHDAETTMPVLNIGLPLVESSLGRTMMLHFLGRGCDSLARDGYNVQLGPLEWFI